ncbi:MAG: hypothetical protein ACLT74_08405 [Christensenellales bacterium]
MNEARLAETSGALFRCEQLKFILQCCTELLRQWANVAAGIAAQDNSPDAARSSIGSSRMPSPGAPHVYSGQKPTPQPSEIRLRTVDGPVHS